MQYDTDQFGKRIEDFVSVRRAARLLGVQPTWFAREVKEGRVPYIENGKTRLVPLRKVRQALEDRAVSSVRAAEAAKGSTDA